MAIVQEALEVQYSSLEKAPPLSIERLKSSP